MRSTTNAFADAQLLPLSFAFALYDGFLFDVEIHLCF